jgi:hypothetical protein
MSQMQSSQGRMSALRAALVATQARTVEASGRLVAPHTTGAVITSSRQSERMWAGLLHARTEQDDPGDEGAVTGPLTVTLVSSRANFIARSKFWSRTNTAQGAAFEGDDFIESLSQQKAEALNQASHELGGVLNVASGTWVHAPTLIASGAIAHQQALINIAPHILRVKHPSDSIIRAAAELASGVGQKWKVLPGSVRPLGGLLATSSLGGTPAGAHHLTVDLRQVVRDCFVDYVEAGLDPEKAIDRLLAASELSWAAVKPASKLAVDMAKEFPVGPFNVFPNMFFSWTFSETGMESIRRIRDEARDNGILDGCREKKIGGITKGALEKRYNKAHKESADYLPAIEEETETSGRMLTEDIKRWAVGRI